MTLRLSRSFAHPKSATSKSASEGSFLLPKEDPSLALRANDSFGLTPLAFRVTQIKDLHWMGDPDGTVGLAQCRLNLKRAAGIPHDHSISTRCQNVLELS